MRTQEDAAKVMALPWMETGTGSAEHYWHFLVGYLMPLAARLDQLPEPAQLQLFDCGPTMNPLLVDAITPHAIQLSKGAKVVSSASAVLGVAPSKALSAPYIDRWDLRIARAPDAELAELKPLIESARMSLSARVGGRACCSPALARGSFLIIKRSDEPDYYKAGGGASIETYGAGRREFLDLESGCSALQAAGLACLIYEPGRHNLACQVAHFSVCAGVIGVRGAEFANVVWARADTTMIMFMANGFLNESPPPQRLSRMFGQNFHTVPHGGVRNPSLNPAVVLRLLS